MGLAQHRERATSACWVVRERVERRERGPHIGQREALSLQRQPREPAHGRSLVTGVALGAHDQAHMQRIDEVDLRQLGGGIADLVELTEAQGPLESRVG